jgi:hypothetical protein
LLIVFIPTNALAPKTMWTPLTALPLIVLPAALLELSTPMRAEPPSNTPTPCRPFCHLRVEDRGERSRGDPSRGLFWTTTLSTVPLDPCW